METNSKRNEHPRCSCTACSRGLRSNAGHFAQSAVNRRIRRVQKAKLNGIVNTDMLDADVTVIVSTPYTD